MSKDDFLAGRASPAFMSPNEPGIRLLRERYSESFALTKGKDNQIHLFLIRVGLWSLVYTFTPRDLFSDTIGIPSVLSFLEETFSSDSPFVLKLDSAVSNARERIKKKVEEYS